MGDRDGMTGTSQLEREIREQPEALARLLSRGREDAEAVAEQIRAARPRSVVIVARGSSDNAARYAQYLFGAHNRLTVSLATPSLFTRYGTPPALEGSLVIGISQSGASPDIVTVVTEAQRQGALTLAITNEPGSPLAQAAAACLPLHAEREHAVVATKTYTNQLLRLAMLSAALEGDPARWEPLVTLPETVAATLDLNANIATQVRRFQAMRHFVVLGRGFNYSTAYEIALKVKETCYIMTHPFSSAEFLHGPVAMVEAGFPALVVLPSGAVYDDLSALLDLLLEREAEVAVISDQASALARVETALPLPAGVPEWLSPLVAVIPGQLWALELAQACGLDPDRPRGLSKVTQTH